LLLTLNASAATSSVTLAWNPVGGSSTAGYRVYQGGASRTYTNSLDAGSATSKTVSELTVGSTYFFAVTAYSTNGLESPYSAEVSYTVAAFRPVPSLTFAADSGVITSPFVTNNGTVYQNVLTGVTTGGRAAYTFTIPSPAPYFLSASVNAPDGGANSFYVNIDAEPTDPSMMWDIPVTSGFTNQFVTWKGEGGSAPKMFNLSAGVHQLIVRGREANAQLGMISIVPVSSLFPVLQLQVSPSRQVLLTGNGPAGHIYDILASQNLTTWNLIGFVTVDASGSLRFTDPTPAVSVSRSYRLRESVPAPTLQISVLPSRQMLLTGPGTPGHKYEVLRTQNFINWTVIGAATVSVAGSFQFIDIAPSGSSGSYRLREVLP